jgi:hypothetical protein
VRFLIGVDDTDNLESRGTGHRVRVLASELGEAALGQPQGITRHQLLVDPRIPYTSHNSSASVQIEVDPGRRDELGEFCQAFLLRESAEGSDVGLCIAARSEVTGPVRQFGANAKEQVLTQEAAHAVAASCGVQLWGLTGTRGGVIGALAAVGLRAEGNDGRFLWLPGLRELTGMHPADELQALAGIQAVQTMTGVPVSGTARVDVGDWPRPVLMDGLAVLLVEEGDPDATYWRAVDRDLVKERSS